MKYLALILAISACTHVAEWPEGRGNEAPAPEWHGAPASDPPSLDR